MRNTNSLRMTGDAMVRGDRKVVRPHKCGGVS